MAHKGNGKEAKLSFCANGLMENSNGLLVEIRVLQATGTAESYAAVAMLHEAVPGTQGGED